MCSTLENEKDHQHLTKNVDILKSWARFWQMSFNAWKCKVLHLARRNTRYEYNMGDIALESVREKGLGVIIDDMLKFNNHTEAHINKANKVLLGFLRRSFVVQSIYFKIRYDPKNRISDSGVI